MYVAQSHVFYDIKKNYTLSTIERKDKINFNGRSLWWNREDFTRNRKSKFRQRRDNLTNTNTTGRFYWRRTVSFCRLSDNQCGVEKGKYFPCVPTETLGKPSQKYD